MTTGERAVLAGSCQRVLRALRELRGPVPLADVAGAVRLHPNTVREHLDALIEEGLVESTLERSGARGRPRALYRLTPAGALPSDPGTDALRLAAIILEAFGQDEAKARATAVAAATRWGNELAAALTDCSTPVDRLMLALDAVGAEPSVASRESGTVGCVHVEHCPFRPLAAVRPDVVCAIHAAAIERVASGTEGEPMTATVRRSTGREGGACMVELRRVGAAGAPDPGDK